jgi:hypothetical protein
MACAAGLHVGGLHRSSRCPTPISRRDRRDSSRSDVAKSATGQVGRENRNLFIGFDTPRKYAETMELEWARFDHKAAEPARDSSIRELVDRLADAEDEHESLAHKLGETILTKPARAREDETSRRLFVQRLFGSGPQLGSRTGASRK